MLSERSPPYLWIAEQQIVTILYNNKFTRIPAFIRVKPSCQTVILFFDNFRCTRLAFTIKGYTLLFFFIDFLIRIFRVCSSFIFLVRSSFIFKSLIVHRIRMSCVKP